MATAVGKVTLRVDEAVYVTTLEILLEREENTFFHEQHAAGKLITGLNVARRGDIFVHVLHYLQFGIIPRDPVSRECLLDAETLTNLAEEAQFYRLPHLEALCLNPGPPPLHIVTTFATNSDRHSYTKVFLFNTAAKARTYYDKACPQASGGLYSRFEVFHCGEDGSVPRDDESDAYIKVIHKKDAVTGCELEESFVNGNCKRSSGASLCIWHMAPGDKHRPGYSKEAFVQQQVRSYPDAHTYY